MTMPARDGDVARLSPQSGFEEVSWPPPFRFRMALPGEDVFAQAVRAAQAGELGAADVLWCDDGMQLHMALVLEPDQPAQQSLAAVEALHEALRQTLAALLPPQVAVDVRAGGAVLVNGGLAGQVWHEMADCAPRAVPPWMVMGLCLNLRRAPQMEGGEEPGIAVLAEEGGDGLSAAELVAGVARRLLLRLDDLKSIRNE